MTADIARQYSNSLPLIVSVRPEDGEIARVAPYRHSVRWAGDAGDSSATYCNACGSAFVRRGSIDVDGTTYPCRSCGGCGQFHGWEGDHPFGPGISQGD